MYRLILRYYVFTKQSDWNLLSHYAFYNRFGYFCNWAWWLLWFTVVLRCRWEKKNVPGVLIVHTQWYFNIFWVGKPKKNVLMRAFRGHFEDISFFWIFQLRKCWSIIGYYSNPRYFFSLSSISKDHCCTKMYIISSTYGIARKMLFSIRLGSLEVYLSHLGNVAK